VGYSKSEIGDRTLAHLLFVIIGRISKKKYLVRGGGPLMVCPADTSDRLKKCKLAREKGLLIKRGKVSMGDWKISWVQGVGGAVRAGKHGEADRVDRTNTKI